MCSTRSRRRCRRCVSDVSCSPEQGDTAFPLPLPSIPVRLKGGSFVLTIASRGGHFKAALNRIVKLGCIGTHSQVHLESRCTVEKPLILWRLLKDTRFCFRFGTFIAEGHRKCSPRARNRVDRPSVCGVDFYARTQNGNWRRKQFRVLGLVQALVPTRIETRERKKMSNVCQATTPKF